MLKCVLNLQYDIAHLKIVQAYLWFIIPTCIGTSVCALRHTPSVLLVSTDRGFTTNTIF